MKRVSPKTILHTAAALIALLLILANTTVVRSVDVFGSPFFFAIGLLVELILLVVYVYSLVVALRTPLRILGSILLSAWGGALTNPYVKQLRRTKSSAYKWTIARLNLKNPFGLYLTIGIAIALVFLVGFSGILQDVWFHKPLTKIDVRVVNLMPSIRTPIQTSFFRFITFTAEIPSVLLLILVASGILWQKRQRVAAGLLVVALVAEEASAFVLKHLVGRLRPAQSLSLIKEDSFSFPSGHVLRATVLFGLLAYLLYRSFKSPLLRLGIIGSYLLSVMLVALSRIYLGVHYPTDVFASILFGASLLTLFITAIEIAIRYKLWGQGLKRFSNKLLGIVPLVVILFSLVASPALIKIKPVTAMPSFTTLPMIDTTAIKRLPPYSETLTGKTMEPVSFIYIGSRQQIEQLFLSHGWYRADPSTVSNTLKALAVGFQGRQYLNAPVTPSFLDTKPEDLAFQKPTASNTLRQRHHTRLWQTGFKLPDGSDVWEATASFDEGIEFAGAAKLPTHHIAPDIDAERGYIISSLGLHNVHYVQIVNPQAGKNASGDIFFTDGKAAIAKL
jgi:membrane-associated phospholipid phosphatase